MLIKVVRTVKIKTNIKASRWICKKYHIYLVKWLPLPIGQKDYKQGMVTDAENHQIRKKNCRKAGFCLHTGWRKTIKEWLVKKLKLTLLWNEGPSLCYESRGTYVSARLDFPTHPLSAPGSPRMRSTKRWECLSKTLVQGGEGGGVRGGRVSGSLTF